MRSRRTRPNATLQRNLRLGVVLLDALRSDRLLADAQPRLSALANLSAEMLQRFLQTFPNRPTRTDFSTSLRTLTTRLLTMLELSAFYDRLASSAMRDLEMWRGVSTRSGLIVSPRYSASRHRSRLHHHLNSSGASRS